jgi:hypothetical protein
MTRNVTFSLVLSLLAVGVLALVMRAWSFAKTNLFADILIWVAPTLTYALFVAERGRRVMHRLPAPAVVAVRGR